MLRYKDIVGQNVKVLSTKDVSIINNENDEDDYIFGALTVEGGGSFKKGVAIGMQEKMIPGLIVYDNENFYGFSEKHGLLLMTQNSEYNQLEFPDSILVDETKDKLQPTKTTNGMDNFENVKNSEVSNKNLNIDLQVKDSSFFYLAIPEKYNTVKYTITFDINYVYDMSSVISYLSFSIINETNKPVFFSITNKNCYFENSYSNIVKEKSILNIETKFINENYILVSTKSFFK